MIKCTIGIVILTMNSGPLTVFLLIRILKYIVKIQNLKGSTQCGMHLSNNINLKYKEMLPILGFLM